MRIITKITSNDITDYILEYHPCWWTDSIKYNKIKDFFTSFINKYKINTLKREPTSISVILSFLGDNQKALKEIYIFLTELKS